MWRSFQDKKIDKPEEWQKAIQEDKA